MYTIRIDKKISHTSDMIDNSGKYKIQHSADPRLTYYGVGSNAYSSSVSHNLARLEWGRRFVRRFQTYAEINVSAVHLLESRNAYSICRDFYTNATEPEYNFPREINPYILVPPSLHSFFRNKIFLKTCQETQVCQFGKFKVPYIKYGTC